MTERPLGDLLIVDERAASRAAILQHERTVIEAYDFGVLARHVGADRAEIALALAPDAEHGFVDDDNAAAERIVNLEPRDLHGECVRRSQLGFAFSTPICVSMPVKS